MFTNKRGKLFSIYSTIVLFCCNYTLSICNCCHKVSNSPSCAFMTSFSNETEIKSLSRLSPGQSSWSSGLVKRIHLVSKTFSIQIESYPSAESLQRTFRTNISLSFRSFLVRIPFLWTRVHFRPVFCKTQRTVSSLMDDEMPAFTITLFTQKFPISSCKSLVCRKIVLLFRTDRFGGLYWLFFGKSATKSPIFFSICLEMVGF